MTLSCSIILSFQLSIESSNYHSVISAELKLLHHELHLPLFLIIANYSIISYHITISPAAHHQTSCSEFPVAPPLPRPRRHGHLVQHRSAAAGSAAGSGADRWPRRQLLSPPSRSLDRDGDRDVQDTLIGNYQGRIWYTLWNPLLVLWSL